MVPAEQKRFRRKPGTQSTDQGKGSTPDLNPTQQSKLLIAYDVFLDFSIDEALP
jgi:hypothetical protein